MTTFAMPFSSCRRRVGAAVRLAAFALFILGAGAARAACGDAGTPCAGGDEPATQAAAGPVGLGAGNPIHIVTGNKYQREVDLPALPGVLGLEIVRHYNSSLSGPGARPGALGRGWRLSYETNLSASASAIQVMQADGSILVFGRELLNPRLAKSADPARGSIAVTASRDGDAYTWTWNDGRKLSFDQHGRLVQILAPTGEILSLQHDAHGLLVRVTDPQGRSLRLAWLDQEIARKGDRFRGVQAIDTPVGRFGYGYGSTPSKGAAQNPVALLANLVKVNYPAPAGTSEGRRYHYEDSHHPTLLTGISIEGKYADARPPVTRYSTYGYQADGKAVLSTHAGGANKVTLAFAAPGQTIVTNSLGQKTVYRHATIANEYRLLEVRGAGCALCGEPNLRYTYDKLGRLTETTKLDDKGRPVAGTRIEPDYYGRPLTVSKVSYVDGKPQPAQWQVRYEYPAGGGAAPSLIARPSVVPGKEASIRYAYNSAGQPLSVAEWGWTPSPDGKTSPTPITRASTFAYRSINGRSVLTRIDGELPNGKGNSPADSDVTQFEYDPSGSFVTRLLAPGGLTAEVRERDAALRHKLVRNSDGVRLVDSNVSYNYAGQTLRLGRSARLISSSPRPEVLTRRIVFTYNANRQLTSVTGPDRTTMRTDYDQSGQPVALIDPKGNRIDSRFDSEGRLLAVVAHDAQGKLINGMLNLWDERNNLRARVSPTGLESARGATVNGGETVTFDGNGEASAEATLGSEMNILAADDSTRQILMSRGGMLFIDGARRMHVISKDDFGRIVMEIAPDEGHLSYRYTGNTFEKHHVAKDGQYRTLERTEYSNGRLAKRTLAGCAETFTYEGNLLARLSGCGNGHRFVRDAFGQIVEHTQTLQKEGHPGETMSFTTRYAYDPDTGQLTQRRLPDGQRLSYRYDAVDGKPVSIWRDAGWLAWIDHRIAEPVANTLRAILPVQMTDRAVIADIEWQPFGGVARLTAGNGVVAQSRFDTSGRVVALGVGDGKGQAIEALRYRYDGAGNISDIERNRQQHSYRYDAMNRLVSEHSTATPRRSNDAPFAEPPGANRGAAQLQAAYSPLGRRFESDAQSGYDSYGRQHTRDRQRFSYDDAHRLITVAQNDRIVARYRYDVLGNRIAKTVGDKTTYFLYNTARQLVGEADGNGNLTSQYLYADLLPVAVLRPQGSGQTRKLFAIHADHRKLPLAVTDEMGAVVWTGMFDAFGNSRVPVQPGVTASNSSFNLISAANAAAPRRFVMNLRMAGQYEDEETGLYYNVHRYYDPLTGRYITADPIGLAAGGQAYAYVGSNPLRQIDPSGLFEIPSDAFLGDAKIFRERELPSTDDGHGDIVRIAFAQLAMESGEMRFSQTIIDQIVLNNYHADANGIGCFGGIGSVSGGGQCNTRNHFDNPNIGPMYSTMPDPKNPNKTMVKLPSYTDNKDDNWIKDALDQVNANRGNYGRVVTTSVGTNISGILNAFGQNTHAIADFYTHTNWTDSSAYAERVVNGKTEYRFARGGEVLNYSYTDPATGKKNKICGWVPPGLSMSTIWDEKSYMDRIFSGSAHGLFIETKISGERYTHSYWNKDTISSTGGEQKYPESWTKSFTGRGMYYWSALDFDKGETPNTINEKLVFGKDWFGDNNSSEEYLKRNGGRMYVRTPIGNRHQMAFYLAIEHTKSEIKKLYAAAANQTVTTGGILPKTFTLREVFGMREVPHQVYYDQLYSKDNGAVTFP